MSKLTAKAGLILITWVLGLNAGQAQQATEQYIPIGQSPGISAAASLIGTITQVDYKTSTMELSGPAGPRTVSMDAATRYYVDRSKQKRSNQLGSLQRCEIGQRVEIKFRDDGKVDWVKIESS